MVLDFLETTFEESYNQQSVREQQVDRLIRRLTEKVKKAKDTYADKKTKAGLEEIKDILGLTDGRFFDILLSHYHLENLYMVELVKKHQGLVQRSMNLQGIFLGNEPPGKVKNYLVEASQCYLYGFYQASIVLCRSVTEALLQDRLRREDWDVRLLEDDRRGSEIVRIIWMANKKGIIDDALKDKADYIRKKGAGRDVRDIWTLSRILVGAVHGERLCVLFSASLLIVRPFGIRKSKCHGRPVIPSSSLNRDNPC